MQLPPLLVTTFGFRSVPPIGLNLSKLQFFQDWASGRWASRFNHSDLVRAQRLPIFSAPLRTKRTAPLRVWGVQSSTTTTAHFFSECMADAIDEEKVARQDWEEEQERTRPEEHKRWEDEEHTRQNLAHAGRTAHNRILQTRVDTPSVFVTPQ